MAKKLHEPSCCWNCGRKLMTKRGGGYNFRLVVDPIGNKHRIHKRCVYIINEKEPTI